MMYKLKPSYCVKLKPSYRVTVRSCAQSSKIKGILSRSETIKWESLFLTLVGLVLSLVYSIGTWKFKNRSRVHWQHKHKEVHKKIRALKQHKIRAKKPKQHNKRSLVAPPGPDPESRAPIVSI